MREANNKVFGLNTPAGEIKKETGTRIARGHIDRLELARREVILNDWNSHSESHINTKGLELAQREVTVIPKDWNSHSEKSK